MKVFLTGTDTGVGKTYTTTLLTTALRRSGVPAVAVKPFCCGDRGDIDFLRDASGHVLSEIETTPVWLAAPAAPSVAARLEGKTLSLDAMASWFDSLPHSTILVEGAGGWLVPINDSETLSDLAVRLGLPVVPVVANRLGCLNHTLLTLESIRSRNLQCPGIVLNTLGEPSTIAERTNAAELSRHTRILLEISRGQRDIPPRDLAAFVEAVSSATDHPVPRPSI
jgi:dethiobiotin synthetase